MGWISPLPQAALGDRLGPEEEGWLWLHLKELSVTGRL